MIPLDERLTQLDQSLLALVRTVNSPLVQVTPLAGVGYPGYQSSALRFLFADGRILKGRLFGSMTRAATVEYVSQYLDYPGFPKVLARTDKALLTEWIEGRNLQAADYTPELLRQCGALQGFMHSIPMPQRCPYRTHDTIQDWCARLARHLDELVESRVIEKDEAQYAFTCAVRHAPSCYAVGFVHRDFCAENMVLRPSDQICVIDDETVGVDSYDYDLGRTWYRWPMTPLQRQAYLDGYRCYRSPQNFLTHFPFWGIVAIIGSAIFRLRRQTDAVWAPIERLRGLLSTLAGATPASEEVFRA